MAPIDFPSSPTLNQQVTLGGFLWEWNGTTWRKINAGKSAYGIAVDNGFVGTEAQWLASLVGSQGPTGATGATGADGASGSPTRTIRSVSTSTTLQSGDLNQMVRFTGTSPQVLTVNNVLTPGTSVEILQDNSGSVELQSGSGVTLLSSTGVFSLRGQNSVITIRCVASGQYRITGDVATTAGAYGFTPFVWYDLSTSAGYTLSGSTVTSLIDRSANSLNASVVGSPQFSATAYNSKPGVTLNGSNQGFTTPNVQFSSPGFTIFMVVKLTNTGMFLEHSTDANNGSFYLYSSTGNSLLYRNGSNSSYNYTNGWTNTKSLLVYQYNGLNAGNFIRADRALMTGSNGESNNPGFASVNAPIYMFSRGNASLWSSGTFSEMVIYKQVLSLSEIQSVENALYTKWGIS